MPLRRRHMGTMCSDLRKRPSGCLGAGDPTHRKGHQWNGGISVGPPRTSQNGGTALHGWARTVRMFRPLKKRIKGLGHDLHACRRLQNRGNAVLYLVLEQRAEDSTMKMNQGKMQQDLYGPKESLSVEDDVLRAYGAFLFVVCMSDGLTCCARCCDVGAEAVWRKM